MGVKMGYDEIVITRVGRLPEPIGSRPIFLASGCEGLVGSSIVLDVTER